MSKLTVDQNRQIGDLRREREVIVTYLLAKQQAEDWHAVADAAMDLRELDAKLSILQSLHKTV